MEIIYKRSTYMTSSQTTFPSTVSPFTQFFSFNFALKMKMFEGNEAWSDDTFYFDHTLQSQSCRIEPANIPLKDNPFPSTFLL
uniref:Uncharacterized protein n=1 Tax=Gossypium raimondii TaxID=29730 RepID=A0A0D2SNM4_GOSRA|nr:hypothetical protein B456_005G261300 [Gossypium raimondii]